ncbi:MAG: transcriptional regulator NrdR [Peptococcaceae bacterium]|nr:transcriptional regulator NrdR [Peptococcaceae bacterium]
MLCPICGGDSKVLDTRTNESVNSVKRRRECMKCGKRFTTYERIEDMPLIVRKKSGRTELFDKSKILKGMAKACEKRPVSIDQLEDMVDQIERQLKNQYTEVSTADIGETIMKNLLQLDQVAYIRFASVYKDFSDIESFFKELEALKNSANSGE